MSAEFFKANPRIREMSRQAVERNPIVAAFVSNACLIEESDGPRGRRYSKVFKFSNNK
jgi:hypothetical protein